MPSNACGRFRKNIKQVDSLLDAYNNMKGSTVGKRALDHFTRAALLFLCAAWEVYIEQITKEAGEEISKKISEYSKLPKPIKQKLETISKNGKKKLSKSRLHKTWREYYLKQIEAYTSELNTPKKRKILDLFTHYLGIPEQRILTEVSALASIDTIVTTRGQIAHNVFAEKEKYLKKDTLVSYYNVITQAVKEIETLLWEYLPEITDKKRPWRNTYKGDPYKDSIDTH